ncbi:MAG: hypothetical protein Crog4KO_02670 [Crocinitomicaceae bacterium]
MHSVHLKNKVTMKMTLKNVGLVLALTFVAFTSSAQKSKVTSAAVEYQKVERGFMIEQGKFAEALEILTTAQGFIDEAYVWYDANKDAKDYDKMFLYRGKIYSSLAMAEAGSKGEKVEEKMIEEYIETSISSFTEGYKVAKKYKRDIEESARKFAGFMGMAAEMSYNADSLEAAGEAYELVHGYLNSINVMDSGSVFNAGICYENTKNYAKAAAMYQILADVDYRKTKAAVRASYCYSKAGEYDKAREVLKSARKKYPENTDVLTQLVNVSLDEGDNEGAMKALEDAVAADPDNAALHYSIGTIHMNLKNFEEAEASLRRSLELDPDNANTQYQLGAHLFNWSKNLTTEARMLDIGDPNASKLNADADQKMKDAIAVLEIYLKKEPNDKYVLDTLYRAYHNQGNTEKSKEYKARLDAL